MVPPIPFKDILTAQRAGNDSLVARALQWADTPASQEAYNGSIAYIPEGLIPAAISADPERLEGFNQVFLGYQVHGVLGVSPSGGYRLQIPIVSRRLNPEHVAPWYMQHLAEREETIEALLEQATTGEVTVTGTFYSKSWLHRKMFASQVLKHPGKFGFADDEVACQKRADRFHTPVDIAMRVFAGESEYLVCTNAYRPASDWIISAVAGPVYDRIIERQAQQEILDQQAAAEEAINAQMPAIAAEIEARKRELEIQEIKG